MRAASIADSTAAIIAAGAVSDSAALTASRSSSAAATSCAAVTVSSAETRSRYPSSGYACCDAPPVGLVLRWTLPSLRVGNGKTPTLEQPEASS